MLELEYKFEQAAAAKGFFAGKSLEHRRPSSAVENRTGVFSVTSRRSRRTAGLRRWTLYLNGR